MGAVLVHIDLDGDRPHPSSLVALAAGRAVASSWGATLYAALVANDARDHGSADSTAAHLTGTVPSIERVQIALSRGGADKVVVAITDAPVAPLWTAIGAAWETVLEHLRPQLVLFGADSPSAIELGPRTGARLGARLLARARVTGLDEVELRDPEGGHARASDGAPVVALIGGVLQQPACDDDVDLLVLVAAGGADPRIELAHTSPAAVAHTPGAIVALGDDVAAEPGVAQDAARLARLLGAPLVGSPDAARAGVVTRGNVVERDAALAPEVCVIIGTAPLELAGATSLVQIASGPGPGGDDALPAPAGPQLASLCRMLEAM